MTWGSKACVLGECPGRKRERGRGKEELTSSVHVKFKMHADEEMNSRWTRGPGPLEVVNLTLAKHQGVIQYFIQLSSNPYN